MPYKDPQKNKEAKKRYYLKNKKDKKKNIVSHKFPPIKIPENIRETQYPGYYIGDDGKAYRSPGKYDKCSELNEYGLIPMNTSLRGNPTHKKYQYSSINVSLRDENGKFLRQKKVNIHRLVAEAFIPNPYNHDSVDHKDRNKQNNNVNNLEWISIKENKAKWERGEEYLIKLSNSLKKRYTVYGIGINDSDFEGRHSSAYIRWTRILKNCKEKNKSICEEWKRYSKFKIWFDSHYINHDSAIYLIKGNEYCPENCVITAYNLINILTFKKTKNYPLGVSLSNPKKMKNIRYTARVGKNYLGSSNSIEECHLLWQKHMIKEIDLLIKNEKNYRILEMLQLVKASIHNDIIHSRETILSPIVQSD